MTKLSKMIMLKQYSWEKREEYCKKKLGIEGKSSMTIVSVKLHPCQHF